MPSMQMCYRFLIPKNRRESDLGLSIPSGLAKRMPLHSGDLRLKPVFGHKLRRKSPPRSRILLSRVLTLRVMNFFLKKGWTASLEVLISCALFSSRCTSSCKSLFTHLKTHTCAQQRHSRMANMSNWIQEHTSKSELVPCM